ncbi:hypothetical protein [Aeromicrobium sp. NPDC092404]|uniref:hypothetical protein n=1 Tax=Aeromicrobium sp. NPDC092404 TaxID=3154976 RepID=UPI00341C78EB
MSQMSPDPAEDDPTQPPADPTAPTAPTSTENAEGEPTPTSPDRVGEKIHSDHDPAEPPD